MTRMPEADRQVAHILLDALSARDDPDDAAVFGASANLALQRLNDVETVTETKDREGNLEITFDPLVNGALQSMSWLIAHLAQATDASHTTVISDLRAFLDA